MSERTRRIKVMIVDDSEVVLEVTRHTLEGAGYEVVTHPRPTGCMALILQEEPDLLLIDVNMPGLNGDTVVKMFGATQRDAHMTVLLHSSLPAHVLQQKAAASGAHGFIRKCESPQDLLRQVARWVRSHSSSGTHHVAILDASRRISPQASGVMAKTNADLLAGTILLADNEMLKLSEYQRLIKSQPGPVEFALSGLEVMRRIQSERPPSVVVLGALLGSPDSDEIAREAGRLNPSWNDRLVLVHDAATVVHHVRQITVLRRPLTETALCTAIQNCLHRAQGRASMAREAP